MIVAGVIGYPGAAYTHDAAACLVVDGKLVGALEQERVSRRRYAVGEGAGDALRQLLTASSLEPGDIDLVGYAWRDQGALDHDEAVTGHDTHASARHLLPELGPTLRAPVHAFDHHLCHAAATVWLSGCQSADVLVVDGTGGWPSTSLFAARDGGLCLVERYGTPTSLGLFYEAASLWAGLGSHGAGKLMGLASYGRPTGDAYLGFDPVAGEFSVPGRPTGSDPLDVIDAWMHRFSRCRFPFEAGDPNVFAYTNFAATVQRDIEQAMLALAKRLHRSSGQDTLLLAGGVALNVHANRLVASSAPYRTVASSSAPHDAGTAIGAAYLAAVTAGERPRSPGVPQETAFLAPPPTANESDLCDLATAVFDDLDSLCADAAARIAGGDLVAWAEGRAEFGPRALGARSLLSRADSRSRLRAVNDVKCRQLWRPAALSLSHERFATTVGEEPWPGLSEYMLAAHLVAPDRAQSVVAGVHVDGTSRAHDAIGSPPAFQGLLERLSTEHGIHAVLNTSLNTHGQPMPWRLADAVEVFSKNEAIDALVVPPFVIARRAGHRQTGETSCPKVLGAEARRSTRGRAGKQ